MRIDSLWFGLAKKTWLLVTVGKKTWLFVLDKKTLIAERIRSLLPGFWKKTWLAERIRSLLPGSRKKTQLFEKTKRNWFVEMSNNNIQIILLIFGR